MLFLIVKYKGNCHPVDKCGTEEDFKNRGGSRGEERNCNSFEINPDFLKFYDE